MPQFLRYVGIDYSGAETPTSSLKGLRVYLADGIAVAEEVQPPPSPRKYWTRRGIAEWLTALLSEGIPTLVGIDHGFSFPIRYFEVHHLLPDWPTDQNIYVDFVRDGLCGNGEARMGNSRWRRLTEERCRAKSVFHFDVQGSVAKSTHAGIPWLRYLRQNGGDCIHFWPFDGWSIPEKHSAIAEIYPSLWKSLYPTEGRTADQHDAYTVATWLQAADQEHRLPMLLQPSPALNFQQRSVAEVEGWILGVK